MIALQISMVQEHHAFLKKELIQCRFYTNYLRYVCISLPTFLCVISLSVYLPMYLTVIHGESWPMHTVMNSYYVCSTRFLSVPNANRNGQLLTIGSDKHLWKFKDYGRDILLRKAMDIWYYTMRRKEQHLLSIYFTVLVCLLLYNFLRAKYYYSHFVP